MTEAPNDPSAPRIITVGGGRGGVGKSTVAAQLAWASAQMGDRVVLVDADLAASSLHLLLGTGAAQAGISALMGRDRAANASCDTRHPNLRLVTGGRNPVRPEALTEASRLRLYRRLRAMEVDTIVVDVGAGLGYDAASLLELGDLRIIVATAQPASVHEAFALLKAVVDRTVRRHLGRNDQLGLLEPAIRTREGEPMSEILRRVHAVDPELAAAVTASLDRFGTFLFGNRMKDGAQVGLLQSTLRLAFDHLAVPVRLLGGLRAGARLPDLASAKDPLALADTDEGRMFRQVATELREAPGAASSPWKLMLGAAAPREAPDSITPCPARRPRAKPPRPPTPTSRPAPPARPPWSTSAPPAAAAPTSPAPTAKNAANPPSRACLPPATPRSCGKSGACSCACSCSSPCSSSCPCWAARPAVSALGPRTDESRVALAEARRPTTQTTHGHEHEHGLEDEHEHDSRAVFRAGADPCRRAV